MTRSRRLRSFVATAALLFSGCATIELVSQYDSRTDEAATEMQKDVTTFFVNMRTALSSQDRSFKANQDFYKSQPVNIATMQVQASNITKNTITEQQLQLVEYQLALLGSDS